MKSDYLITILQYILPKHALTILAGFLAQIKHPIIKNYLINYFIRKYKVNLSEALEENPRHYANFNEFFIRKLKPQCRPIAPSDIVSPVDGYISEIGKIESGMLMQAKNHFYTVAQLLACTPELSAKFNCGIFATLYLSPQDYHRVHMPLDAQLLEMIYIPGTLFSVQPATARTIPRLFARNERLVVYFESSAGLMAMVLVGATIVGAIAASWHGELVRKNKIQRFTYPRDQNSICLKQAQEMGYFKLGSTVILLFADDKRVGLQQNLSRGDKIQFGQALGSILGKL